MKYGSFNITFMYNNEKIYGREEFDQITGRNEIELVRDRCKKRGKWNADERAEVMGKDKGGEWRVNEI